MLLVMENNNIKWEKPELEVLGDAQDLIMGSGQAKDLGSADGFTFNGNPIGQS